MSDAQPMTETRRRAAYLAQTGRRDVTTRQARRIRHKNRRSSK